MIRAPRDIRIPADIPAAVLALQCMIERIGVRNAARRLGWSAATLSRRMSLPESLTLLELAQLARVFGSRLTIADPDEQLVGHDRVRHGRPPKLLPEIRERLSAVLPPRRSKRA